MPSMSLKSHLASNLADHGYDYESYERGAPRVVSEDLTGSTGWDLGLRWGIEDTPYPQLSGSGRAGPPLQGCSKWKESEQTGV